MYAAIVEGQKLTFGVAGVWRRNMVIRDRETGTVWQQATGEAIAGPLKGKQLTLVGGSLGKWGMWAGQHPDGILGTEPDPPAPNLLSVDGMVKMFSGTDRFAGPGLAARDDHRLPAHEIVIGVVADGVARAYPLAVVRKLGEISDTLGGKMVTIIYHPEGDTVTVQGESSTLQMERGWWLGWSEFHPDTDIFS